jgi:2-phosphosulfolactate phosphatase
MIVKKGIDVCFSPALYDKFHNKESIVVIVDILRATSAICTAFMNGVKTIIPVETLEEAKKYKSKGYLVAAERDGIIKSFADFGNSPFNFTKEKVAGKVIVYSTTNGTRSIHMAKKSCKIVIGSYLNIDALSDCLVNENHNIVILCAGWKDKFNLEDTLFAGCLADKLLHSGHFETICDSTYAAMDLWSVAKNDLMGYIEKTAQRNRLKKNNLDDVIDFCHRTNLSDIVPVWHKNRLIRLVN